MTKLSSIADYVTDKISSNDISLREYITTDCILQNKKGREVATNLPPQPCNLTRYQCGDVLIANIRPYLKKVWFADNEGGASSDVLVFRAKDGHSSRFLYAVLLQDAFFDYVMQGAKGSKMPRGDKEQILRYEIPILSCSEESIGTFFLNFDHKIRLNKQINQNLGALAKQLYDYWFVQFDFPNEEGKPYKSSGGKMVWNEKLKREIPEGWEVASIVDNPLSSVIKSGVNRFSSKEYLATAEINGTSISSGNIVDYETREGRANMQPTINSVWFAKMKNSIKHLFLNNEMQPIINETILSTGFCGIQCSDNSFEYISSFVSSDYFETIKDLLAHGATQEAVNNEDMQSILLLIPDDEVLFCYHKTCKSLYAQISKNICENRKLTAIRDWLLPLLMNGQITIE